MNPNIIEDEDTMMEEQPDVGFFEAPVVEKRRTLQRSESLYFGCTASCLKYLRGDNLWELDEEIERADNATYQSAIVAQLNYVQLEYGMGRALKERGFIRLARWLNEQHMIGTHWNELWMRFKPEHKVELGDVE